MTGPYAYVRNPMQIAGLLLALLLPLQYPTPYMLFYMLDMGLVSLVLFALFERDELADRFGEEFVLRIARRCATGCRVSPTGKIRMTADPQRTAAQS